MTFDDLVHDENRQPEIALEFGPYRLIPSQRLLLHGKDAAPIGSRALDLLITLVENSGEVVSKEQLIAAAWPTTNVHEANLRVHIGGLRKMMRDGQAGVRYIVSEAGRGYRFVAPVSVVEEASVEASSYTAEIAPTNLVQFWVAPRS